MILHTIETVLSRTFLRSLDSFDAKHLESETLVFFFPRLTENNYATDTKCEIEGILVNRDSTTYHKSFTLPYMALSPKKLTYPQNLRRHVFFQNFFIDL